MKLLSPKEVKTALQEEEERIKFQKKATSDALREEEQKLNALRARFSVEEAQNRKKEASEKEAHVEKIKVLLSEISKLEDQKKALLRSVDLKRLEEREKAISIREEAIKQKEEMQATWRKDLEKEQASHLDWSIRLNAQATEIMQKKIILDSLEEEIAERDAESQTILNHVRNWEVALAKEAQELYHKEEAFRLKQQAEEAAQEEMLKLIKKEQKKLDAEKVSIKDGYATLLRAREEVLGRKT